MDACKGRLLPCTRVLWGPPHILCLVVHCHVLAPLLSLSGAVLLLLGSDPIRPNCANCNRYNMRAALEAKPPGEGEV